MEFFGGHFTDRVTKDALLLRGTGNFFAPIFLYYLQVGHNIYILAYKLADHKRELKEAISHANNRDAVKFYAANTAQIEVRSVHIANVCSSIE